MKYILKYSLALAIALVALSSCEDKDQAKLNSAIYPSSVVMIIPEQTQKLIYVDPDTGVKTLPLIKGETVTFSATIAPDNVTSKELIWSSSNKSVATVDQNGVITAISEGGTGYSIIQLSPSVLYSGSGIYGSLKVIVVDEKVAATSITVSSAANEVYAGETLQLSAAIAPAEATYKTVIWSSSDETIATVDANGLVTGKESEHFSAPVTISATSMDGANIVGSKQITIKQIVAPESTTIDQTYSVESGYLCPIALKKLTLSYTTVPAECTTSLIEWSSSDASIATVAAGVVTFNQLGVFGEVTITAKCPETGHESTIKINIPAGLIRELFKDQNNYSWYNAVQSGGGNSTSHVWSEGKITVTTYSQNGTNQRGDLKCWSDTTWLHAGNYPIFAIRMDDATDMGISGITARNITFDGAGGKSGDVSYAGGLGGNNQKWVNDYKCSDGSHVFIYDLATQAWATGGVLPTTAVTKFKTLQFKYADIKTISTQIQYNVYWIQTFKTIADVQAYIASEGLTYTVIR